MIRIYESREAHKYTQSLFLSLYIYKYKYTSLPYSISCSHSPRGWHTVIVSTLQRKMRMRRWKALSGGLGGPPAPHPSTARARKGPALGWVPSLPRQ